MKENDFKKIHPKSKYLIGKKFNRLFVLDFIEILKDYRCKWLCQCDCGNKVSVSSYHLTSGRIKSCGCLNKEIVSNLFKTHGKRKLKSYDSWAKMIQRCNNPNCHNFHDYGGRGIKVCERWYKFENFYEDMGDRPDNLTLHRINNDLGYFKENCIWATRKVQARTRRSNKLLTFDNQTKLVVEWSEILNIPQHIINRRLYRGWSVEKSLTVPYAT